MQAKVIESDREKGRKIAALLSRDGKSQIKAPTLQLMKRELWPGSHSNNKTKTNANAKTKT